IAAAFLNWIGVVGRRDGHRQGVVGFWHVLQEVLFERRRITRDDQAVHIRGLKSRSYKAPFLLYANYWHRRDQDTGGGPVLVFRVPPWPYSRKLTQDSPAANRQSYK
ncbi:MAG: hypothetical protein V2I25_00005, partial [Woeseiaceae bacterium]|nr:hypothetical protein [Woeseiaceae bacterium]